MHIVVDSDREIFAQWGLGVSSLWHVLNPASLWSAYKLGREQGIVSNFRAFLSLPIFQSE